MIYQTYNVEVKFHFVLDVDDIQHNCAEVRWDPAQNISRYDSIRHKHVNVRWEPAQNISRYDSIRHKHVNER